MSLSGLAGCSPDARALGVMLDDTRSLNSSNRRRKSRVDSELEPPWLFGVVRSPSGCCSDNGKPQPILTLEDGRHH